VLEKRESAHFLSIEIRAQKGVKYLRKKVGTRHSGDGLEEAKYIKREKGG